MPELEQDASKRKLFSGINILGHPTELGLPGARELGIGDPGALTGIAAGPGSIGPGPSGPGGLGTVEQTPPGELPGAGPGGPDLGGGDAGGIPGILTPGAGGGGAGGGPGGARAGGTLQEILDVLGLGTKVLSAADIARQATQAPGAEAGAAGAAIPPELTAGGMTPNEFEILRGILGDLQPGEASQLTPDNIADLRRLANEMTPAGFAGGLLTPSGGITQAGADTAAREGAGAGVGLVDESAGAGGAAAGGAGEVFGSIAGPAAGAFGALLQSLLGEGGHPEAAILSSLISSGLGVMVGPFAPLLSGAVNSIVSGFLYDPNSPLAFLGLGEGNYVPHRQQAINNIQNMLPQLMEGLWSQPDRAGAENFLRTQNLANPNVDFRFRLTVPEDVRQSYFSGGYEAGSQFFGGFNPQFQKMLQLQLAAYDAANEGDPAAQVFLQALRDRAQQAQMERTAREALYMQPAEPMDLGAAGP